MRRRIERMVQVLTGWRDRHRLRLSWPLLARDLDARQTDWPREPVYSRYVDAVSSEEMAISVELSRFSEAVLEATSARRVLDLGSGFSSYLFRAHFRDAGRRAAVYSVDDDPGWLEETRRFLASEDLPTENLLPLDELDRIADLDFDVVFYDLGRMPTRTAWLPRVLDEFASPGTSLLVDDVHKFPYGRQVRAACGRRGLTHYSLRAFTLDRHGRHAALVTA